MGIIDKFTYTFTCPNCGSSEVSTAVQRGSAYGASPWAAPSEVVLFKVLWATDAMAGPTAVSATCKSCGGSARIETR